MNEVPQVLCIGSVLWDIIGRAPTGMVLGNDVPGRITRLPGGVAMNIAMALNGFGMRVALLSAVGTDAEGRDLVQASEAMGLNTGYLLRSAALPTDRYMAIEAENGLIAAIADAHSLEAAGERILDPLRDGRLADRATPWRGLVVLDGNLPTAMLTGIAEGAMFEQADLRVAPASPGKAGRLIAFLAHPRATIYLNLIEANILTGQAATSTSDAADALIARGLGRVLVTDGANPAAEAHLDGFRQSLPPPAVTVRKVTGAGDMFMAAHIAAEKAGKDRPAALQAALDGAARYISAEGAA